MTASLAASSPVLRRPLLSFAVRSDFLLKPRISARSAVGRPPAGRSDENQINPSILVELYGV